jgi:hypothetical protein
MGYSAALESMKSDPQNQSFAGGLTALESLISYNPDTQVVDENVHRTSSFFPDSQGIEDETIETTNDIFPYSNFQADDIDNHPLTNAMTKVLDVDSVYGISTNPDELANALTTEYSVWEFHSLTKRSSANSSSRFALCGRPEDIKTRLRGQMPKQVNLEKMPNIQIAHLQSEKPGVGFSIHLVYLGLPYIPESNKFNDAKIAVVNLCFNLARVKCKELNTTRGLFLENDISSYVAGRQISALHPFESPFSEGPPANKRARLNARKTLHSTIGSSFFRAYFEVLKNIATSQEGFTVHDDIWGKNMHGNGGNISVSFTPSLLQREALDLHKNFIVTFQAAGTKESFEGEIGLPIVANANNSMQAKEAIAPLIMKLKDVLDLSQVKNCVSTLLFVDLGENYYTDIGTSVMFKLELAASSLRDMMRQVRRRQPPPLPTSDATISLFSSIELEETVLDDHLYDHDFIEREEELNENEISLFEALQLIQEARQTCFHMFATRELGNLSTGKIRVWISRNDLHEVSNVYNPRRNHVFTGTQMYNPASKEYLQKRVRDFDNLYARLPMLFLNLFSDPSLDRQKVASIWQECQAILDQLESTMQHLLRQVREFGIGCARVEHYLDLGVILTEKIEVIPDGSALQPCDCMVVFKNEDMSEYLATMCTRVITPLRTLVDTECGRPIHEKADLAALPASAKTAIVAKAELSVLLTNPSFCQSRVLNNAMNGHSLQTYDIPIQCRKELNDNVKSWTGLSYGVDPMLLLLEGANVPVSAHSPIGRNTTPLSHVMASYMRKEVLLPLVFIQARAAVNRCMIQHARIYASVGDQRSHSLFGNEHLRGNVNVIPLSSQSQSSVDDELPADIDFISFFDEINASDFVNATNEDSRAPVYVDLARILIQVYEVEWHYQITKNNQVDGDFTELRNTTVGDFPVTITQVYAFKAQVGNIPIDAPAQGQTITTESTYSQTIERSLFFFTSTHHCLSLFPRCSY